MAAVRYAAPIVAAAEAALLFFGPFRVAGALSYLDVLYLALLALCALSDIRPPAVGLTRTGTSGRAPSEALLFATLVLSLFGFIYAANANMDYVQRVAAYGGNVRLAPSTRVERLTVALRFGPVLLVALWGWLRASFGQRHRVAGLRPLRFSLPPLVDLLGYPLSLASAVAVALSFPSFLVPSGIGWLAFVAWVPLFAVLRSVGYGRALFYGTAAWTVQTMLSNTWLGTYSLVSLQLVTVVLAAESAAFFALALGVERLVRRGAPAASVLVLPLAWTVFDYLRTVGFLGYPWSLAGTTQYAYPTGIQLAAVTGVWGVGFVVLAVNAAVAELAAPAQGTARARVAVLGAAIGLAALTFAVGAVVLARPEPPARDVVRLALVQQNNDPRKNDYEQTFTTLRRLTDGVLGQRPDLVVWSETAFVPNIRRWSAEDPAEQPLADLVRRFLDYQRGTGTWLLTGNDDYERRWEDGAEVRLDYNAAVLFSGAGERVETYRKMRLVPFTESFPWKRQLPGAYRLLQSFDVHLWEPGTERVVFRHPRFRFCTPVCFEDAFPDHVRRFVLEGVDIIVNISNDYWSLAEVEALQHAANAVFRAVENRTPVVRATASGLTTHIDPYGRRLESLPCYTEGALVVDVPLSETAPTLYAAWGDWFPGACAAALLALCCLAAVRGRRRGARARGSA